jgi:hypothetical protein
MTKVDLINTLEVYGFFPDETKPIIENKNYGTYEVTLTTGKVVVVSENIWAGAKKFGNIWIKEKVLLTE